MRFSFLALAMLTALAGCQAAPHLVAGRQATLSARSDAGDLYPLTPGTRWEYVLHQRQDDGPVRERAMAIRISERKALADGGVEAVLERAYDGVAPPPTRVRRYADRVTLSRLADPPDGPSITILRLPLTAGESWPGRALGGGHSETIHARGPEAVTVPAGTFQAERVDHEIAYATGGGDTLSYWYAPGRGVVKMIERATVHMSGQTVRLEVTGLLTRYAEASAPLPPAPELIRREVGRMPLN